MDVQAETYSEWVSYQRGDEAAIPRRWLPKIYPTGLRLAGVFPKGIAIVELGNSRNCNQVTIKWFYPFLIRWFSSFCIFL